MAVSSYPMLALIAALAALAVAASALLVRSRIADQGERETGSEGHLSPAVMRRLSVHLFGMAALMAVLALVLELGGVISGLVGFSSAYICEGVLALGIGILSMIARHSYRNLRRSDGCG